MSKDFWDDWKEFNGGIYRRDHDKKWRKTDAQELDNELKTYNDSMEKRLERRRQISSSWKAVAAWTIVFVILFGYMCFF